MKKLVEITLDKWEQLNSLGLDTVFDYKNDSFMGDGKGADDGAMFLEPDEIIRGLREGDYDKLISIRHYAYMKETFPGTQFKFYAMVEGEH